MRVLFVTWAWPTHFFPMVPLGWACAAAGHDVRVASQPGLAETISHSGLTAVRVGSDVDFAARQASRQAAGQQPPPGASGPDEALRVWRGTARNCAELCELMAADLRAFCLDWRPRLIVWDWLTFAAPIVARELGIPSLRLRCQPDFMLSMHQTVAAMTAGDRQLSWPRDLFARHGVPFAGPPGAWGGDGNLDTCPPSVQPADPGGIAARYLPYSGPAQAGAPPARPARRPRVCVTMGMTMSRLRGADHITMPGLLEALAGLDIDVLVAVPRPDPALARDLPGNITVAEGMPLDVLLPGCAAIVHHGGIGTAMTAARHALPQVITPVTADQPLNARRFAATGAALDVSAAAGPGAASAGTHAAGTHAAGTHSAGTHSAGANSAGAKGAGTGAGAAADGAGADADGAAAGLAGQDLAARAAAAVEAVLGQPGYRQAAAALSAQIAAMPAPSQVVPALTGFAAAGTAVAATAAAV
ncbi:MAG TPA: nucleotide disphospho-sugar-binding domain-containing protein [Streptosporangiaceae bacterium]|jgi:UDP:flavonoid glycosyltransferase YjiC (YdhE family)